MELPLANDGFLLKTAECFAIRGTLATREVLSVTVIIGSICCVSFCVMFLVSSALHDLANGTKSLYNYVIANAAYTDDNAIEEIVEKLAGFAEENYEVTPEK